MQTNENFIWFIYKLKAQKIFLWKNNDESLGFSFDKTLGFAESDKKYIYAHKTKILQLLSYNQILSKTIAENTAFLAIPYKLTNHKLDSIQKGMLIQSYLDSPRYTYTIPVFIYIKKVHYNSIYQAVRQFLKEQVLFRMQVNEDFSYEILPIENINIKEITIDIEKVNDLCKAKSMHEFILYNELLITPEIIKILNTDHVIVNLTHHHMLSDAYSINLIKKEFIKIYENIILNNNINITHQLNYLDYVEYKNFLLKQHESQEAINNIARKLETSEPLNLKQKNATNLSHQSTVKYFNLETSVYDSLKTLSYTNNVSLYSILVTGFYYTLSVFAGEQTNFPLGITVASRPQEFNSTIGPFINALPLIIDNFNLNNSILRNIKTINKEIIALNECNIININMAANSSKKNVQEILHLMQIMFTLHNFNNNEISYNTEHELIVIPETTEKFGITLTAKEQANTIYFELNFINELFEHEYINQIIEAYTNVLLNLTNTDVLIPINALSLLNKFSYEKIINTWNQTYCIFNDKATIHGMFEQQVLKTPDNLAVRYEQKSLTYTKLNQLANKLANYLAQTYQIVPDTLICICLDRSHNMLITILGILKSGAAYVPIDPLYPDNRIKYILQDTKSTILITNKQHSERLKFILQDIIYLKIEVIDDLEFQQYIYNFSKDQPKVTVSSNNLAYVIYTSGTTGYPKGTMLEHRGIVNRIQWMNKAYPLDHNDKILLKTPYVFDVSIWELFWANWYGSAIICAKPEMHKDPEYLINIINQENISIIHFVPSMLNAFQETLGQRSLISLRYIFCSGEELKLDYVKKHQSLLPNTEIHNLYGPTEASVDVLYFNCNSSNLTQINIGQPIDNTSIYICNSALNPVPIGAIGELYIGGVNLARGYLNKPSLTAEKFINNPFNNLKLSYYNHDKLYKTGDLARYHPDGQIEFIGRKDFQVKIRGYRIELTEIEAVLSQVDGIKQSVVLIKEYLIGYYVASIFIDKEKILAFMHQHLPEYMVPNVFIHLESIPLTLNGKLDRKALLNMEIKNIHEIIEPHNNLESSLRSLWAEVLNKKIQHISIRDDFFSLGGDSITTIQLISKLKQQLGIKINAKDLFNNKTIEKLSKIIIQKQEYLTKSDFTNVKNEASLESLPLLISPNKYDWFEMTEIQKSYLIGRLGSYEIGNVSNHIYSEYYYKTLCIEKLEVALNILIKQFDALRTIFSLDLLQQRYLTIEEINYYKIKVTDYKAICFHEENLKDIRNRLSHHIYNVSKFPLFTFEVSCFKDCFVLHFSMDLILLDVHSRISFLNLLNKLYNDTNYSFSIPSISFKDYQNHIQSLKKSKWYQDDFNYWQNKIKSLPLRPSLPIKIDPSSIEDPKFCEHTIYIDQEIWQKFKYKIKDNNISESTALLALYSNVISYFSQDKEFIVTLTLFNRYAIHKEINDIWGDFTSTTIFHYINFENNIFKEIQHAHDTVWEDISHAFYPGVNVQRDLAKYKNLEITKAVSPIVFTGFISNTTKSYDTEAFLDNSEVINNRFWCAQTSQAWIDLQAVEVSRGLMSKWLYVSQLFDKDLIISMNYLFCKLIKYIANNTWNNDHAMFDYLPDASRTIINNSNQAIQPENLNTLFGQYKHIYKNIASNIAVIDCGANTEYSHLELWNQSELLARYLTKNFTSNKLIAVLSQKGYNQVVATLAIMKAGCAYLPLNIDWPVSRIIDIMNEGSSDILMISRQELSAKNITKFAKNKHILIIEDILTLDPELYNDICLPTVNPSDIAYVIFTSGSTGKPKGVTISHQGALNTIDAINKRFNITSKDKVLALSELSFDLSVYDIFGLLAVGGTIVFPIQEKTKNPNHWLDIVQKHQITIWNTVPQLAMLFTEEVANNITSILPCALRLFLLSGDWIPLTLPLKIKQYFPNSIVMSLGGATEGSIWSIWYEIHDINPNWTSIPYGFAMPNQKMYVLNQQNNHCPIGVSGEIHIGGIGLALNYWGDPNLTNEKFINHPELGRLYKTGDLGKWHYDGYIEFLGRKDFQVKIRGYRVELGEIEAILSRFNGIKQSVVLIKEHLVAYYVATIPLENKAILDFMQQYLPEYMIPSALICLESIPLTLNGKLDRQALLNLEVNNMRSIIPPTNNIEADIRELWAEVLHKNPNEISMQDDFFYLGGDSITSIQLISKFRRQLGINIKIKDLFNNRTIEKISKIFNKENLRIQTEQDYLTDIVPLLPIQQWFFLQNFAKPHHWNQAFVVKVPELIVEKLIAAMQQLCMYHDALRLRYRQENNKYLQYYSNDHNPFVFHTCDINTIDLNKLSSVFTSWQSEFNLTQGPLICLGYIYGYNDGSARIFLACHHLIIDTVSWSILLTDLQLIYNDKPLKAKGTSYRQWGGLVYNYHTYHEQERAYWNAVLSDYSKPNYLQRKSTAINNINFSINLQLDKIYNNNINNILLSAIGLALKDMSGSYINHILTEGHGREELTNDIDITNTVGWFTTLYPVKLEVTDDINTTLQYIKENLNKIPNKGLGYGALFGYKNTLPEITFNYLGKLDQYQTYNNWFITTEDPGQYFHSDNQLLNTISILAYIHNNKLFFNISSVLEILLIKKLIKFLKNRLKELLNFVPTSNTTYLANSLQQGFIYHSLTYKEQDSAYRIQMKWHYQQSINVSLLKKAWELAVQTFPSLRVCFSWNEKLLQIIKQKVAINWTELNQADHLENLIKDIELQDINKPYDLNTAPLFRIYLIKQTNVLYTCIVNIHHAIIDGWSGHILIDFVHNTYLRLKNNQSIIITEDVSYIHSQEYLQQHKNFDLNFWKEYLKKIEEPINLTGLFLDHARMQDLNTYKTITKNNIQILNIKETILEQLRSVCKQENLTINTIFQYAWHKLLSAYGKTQTTVVGTIFSGRTLPIDGIEQSVGLYINNLPLILEHKKYINKTILFALKDTQEQINHLQDHCLIDLAQLHSHGKKLFYSIFIFENYPNNLNKWLNSELNIQFEPGYEKHDYPLVISIIDKKDSVLLKLEYDSGLFSCQRIKSFLDTYYLILEQIIFNIHQETNKIYYLTLQPTNIVNNFSPKATLADLFEEQVLKTPDNCAVIFKEKLLNYSELNSRANQLAHVIMETCNNSQLIIGIYLDRGEDLIISLIATAKLGAAYVPLSPAFPKQRLNHITQDIKFALIITTSNLQKDLLDLLPNILVLDEVSTSNHLLSKPKNNPIVTRKLNDLLYIIYTSGTTGKPNGVMIEQQSFIAVLQSIKNRYFDIYPQISTFSVTNFVFDIFGLEYALPLITGGTLTIGDYDFEQLNCLNYTFIQMTPQLLNLKLNQFINTENTILLVGGEALKYSFLTKSLQFFQKIINVYGPTETTIWSTAKLYTKEQELPSFVTIGSLLDNEFGLVLDEFLSIVPIGAVGELYLGGCGLARGYWNNHLLTTSKFINNPYPQAIPSSKLYKTGDLVRALENGEFEYIGRIDFQTKIRGYRIELEEIENVLMQQEFIKQSAAMVIEHNEEQYIAAYIVTANLKQFNEDFTQEQFITTIKESLKKYLPEYMIPQYFSFINEIPLNINGKIDRKALKTISIPHVKKEFIAIKPNEQLLHTIWSNVLQRTDIGRHDNFFDLGGNSLLLIKMLGQLSTKISKKINILDIFKYPTIAELNTFLEKNNLPNDNYQVAVTKLQNMNDSIQQNDIAIIGMAGCFPKADNIHELWDNLLSGRECTTFYSKEELIAAGVITTQIEQSNYIRAQAKLKNIKTFDAKFFGYSKKEAEVMDPQHRIFMECAWTALEDANYNPFNYKGTIGIFGGCGQNDYFLNHVLASQPNLDMAEHYQLMINNQNNFLCTKIAYKLNLTGPAITIQTACSTSLVAVHQASIALLTNDCDIALAGAVSIGQIKKSGYIYQEGMIFSPDGKCRAFDQNANGTFEGQGAGIVVLKPLNKALKDNDLIYAVIKGTAINNDGKHKIGYTAPSVKKQADVIRLALNKAKVTANTISYIEAHGTGTTLGDPIEINALTEAFRETTTKNSYCAIGSVKTNFGHLDVASGIAGLIKTVLCLYNKKLVPSLHFKTANPQLNLHQTPFFVNTKVLDWTTNECPRRAGVSSFGIGGTNAHAILEEAPITNNLKLKNFIETNPIQLISISANSEKSLNQQVINIKNHICSNTNLSLASIAYTLHTRRQRFKYNAFYITSEKENIYFATCSEERPIIFIFPNKPQTLELANIFINLGIKPAIIIGDEINNIEKTIAKPDFKHAILLQIGSDQILNNLNQKHQDIIMAKLNDLKSFLTALGYLWAYGVEIDWNKYYAPFNITCSRLPTYVFEKTEYWIEPTPKLQLSSNKTFEDPILRIVKQSWKKILGNLPLNLEDDFFYCGGDSLAAVQFINQIKKETGLTIDLVSLEKPSIKNIATYLQTQDQHLTKQSCLVKIKQGDINFCSPMIFIHPIGGDIYFYRDLISCLPNEQTVYGIRSPMLNGINRPNSIEELSSFYIKLLKDHNIINSCILLGGSFGGIVAYEIAQQIYNLYGFKLKIIMIDSPAYTSLPKPMSNEDILIYLLKYGLIDFKITAKELINIGDLAAQINFIAKKASIYNKEHFFTKDFIETYLNTWQTHSNIMHKYKPKPYKGDVVFFAHQEIIDEFPTDQDQHWQSLVKGNFISYRVPGNHISMNAYPNVKIIGDKIKSIFNNLICIET